jgi:TM2 domain-containing membrane protein YozV
VPGPATDLQSEPIPASNSLVVKKFCNSWAGFRVYTVDETSTERLNMFRIIGADGRQYGPVSTDQLRRWLAEGRAGGHTLVQPEGAQEWKELSLFPEFAADLKAPPPPPLAQPPGVQPIDAAAKSKASNKLAAGICGILLGGFGVHKFVLGYVGTGMIMLLVSILSCGLLYWLMHLIGLIEGIVYLAKSDEEFVRLYVDGRKTWF